MSIVRIVCGINYNEEFYTEKIETDGNEKEIELSCSDKCDPESTFIDLVGNFLMESAIGIAGLPQDSRPEIVEFTVCGSESGDCGSYYNRQNLHAVAEALSLNRNWRMRCVDKGTGEIYKDSITKLFTDNAPVSDGTVCGKEREIMNLKFEYVACPRFADVISEDDAYQADFGVHVKKAADFAHPVDSKIIDCLNNTIVEKAFTKMVQIQVDTNYGLALESGIHVTEKVAPELYAVVCGCAKTLDIPVPYVIFMDSGGPINAFTTGTDAFSFVALGKLMPRIFNTDELRFVIGHECGHLALGHIVYHSAVGTIGSLGRYVPIVGDLVAGTITLPLMAWYRRSEISADRAGLICCGDVDLALHSLLKIETGLTGLDKKVDIDDYIKDSENARKENYLGKYKELLITHPITPRRLEALRLFARSEKYYRITGKPVPEGMELISDQELDRSTEEIISIVDG